MHDYTIFDRYYKCTTRFVYFTLTKLRVTKKAYKTICKSKYIINYDPINFSINKNITNIVSPSINVYIPARLQELEQTF